jgi:hypothetical protein
MTDAWIVVRQEKHIDERYWVCVSKEDALKIAADVVAYWTAGYHPDPDCVDTTLYDDQLFHVDAEDAFRVVVQPQQIRDVGEVGPNVGIEPPYSVGSNDGLGVLVDKQGERR